MHDLIELLFCPQHGGLLLRVGPNVIPFLYVYAAKAADILRRIL
jgi:hypothetical protein